MSNSTTTPKPKTINRDMIIINTSHYAGGNRYQYKFPNPISFKKARVSVHQVSLYNSTYNISSSLGNNTYSVIWINGTTYNFVLDDGYYSASDLNDAIQLQMATRGLYCISGTGSNQLYVFFVSIQTNPVQYKMQLDVSYVPTSSQANSLGYSLPSGVNWSFPNTPKTPQLVLSSGLQTLLGFNKQTTFPTTPQTTNQTFLSTTYPIISPVFCYIFTTNLLNSRYNAVPTVLYQLPLTASYGSLITVTNQAEQKLSIRDGTYSFVEIQLWDQFYNLLDLQDPELVLALIIETDED